MLLELFLFVILNNAMAFVYAYFFSDFLRFDRSLLLLYSLVHVGPGNTGFLTTRLIFINVCSKQRRLLDAADARCVCSQKFYSDK